MEGSLWLLIALPLQLQQQLENKPLVVGNIVATAECEGAFGG